jgi:hypothetical protein
MEDWTRVLLYGTFDGFTYSTDDLPRIVVVLDDGERVEVPKECVISADQMVNKNKIKLKDVIARIKSFDVGAKEVWLNEILNELGSDYGSLKYRAGYEQGRFDGAIEREKVTVPQFVADYIKDAKYYEWDLDDVFDHIAEESEESEIYKWFYTLGNVDVFARAWLDGYTVDKEKRYLVKMKNLRALFCYLAYIPDEGYWSLMASGGESIVIKHTRKELEEAGFGEVFNSPLFEVEEVEE